MLFILEFVVCTQVQLLPRAVVERTTGLGTVCMHQLIVYFLDSVQYIIIHRNPITQKPYGGYHSIDRSMRRRRVWALHGDQLIVYFLDSFICYNV